MGGLIMKTWFCSLPAIIILAFFVSCSSGNSRNPVTPIAPPGSVPDLSPAAIPTDSHTMLWGYFDLFMDPDEMKVEAVPNRTAGYSINVVQFLNANPLGVTVSFNGKTVVPGYITIDMDVTITHPLNNAKFDGYDVRGVLLGRGSQTMLYDTGLNYAVKDVDQELLNADGYTRWFNFPEFISPGIFGYTPGILAPPGYNPDATLNPYKYFGEGLTAGGSVWSYLTSGDPNVGYFLHGTSNTRNYQVRFPIPIPGIKYGYAIIANWEGGDPQFHPSHSRETVGCGVLPNHTLYYIDDSDNGGALKFDLSIFDWLSELNGGSMSDYTIWIESTVLSSDYVANANDMTPIGGGENFSTYRFDIPADNVTGLTGNEMFVIVEYPGEDYTNPFNVPNLVDAPLTAFFRYDLEVLNVHPPEIQLIAPNGGEMLYSGFPTDVQWSSQNITSGGLNIFYSNDNFFSDWHQIATNVPNTGSWTWDPIADDPSDTVKVWLETNYPPLAFDVSDSYFSILAPTLTLTSPNGGENWISGHSEDITWLSEGVSGTVTLEYSTDDFTSEIVEIVSGTENDGTHTWGSLPFIDSSTVKVRVKSDINISLFDDSDANFAITPPWIQVTSPNGGENWQSFSSEEITWTSGGDVGNVGITFSDDNFSGINDLVLTVGAENDGSFIWTDIPCMVTNNGMVKVWSVDFPLIYDDSDSGFTVTPAAAGWVRPLQDTGPVNAIMEVEAVTEGAFYLTGYTQDSNSDSNAFLSKQNSCEELWRVDISANGTGDIVESYGVAVDGSNNVYITGVFEGAVDFNPTGGALRISNGSTDVFLAKYTEDGTFDSVLTWGDSGNDFGYDVSADISGGVYVTGAFEGTDVDFDPGAGTALKSSNGIEDIYLTKFNSMGMHQFTHVWGGTGTDIGYGIKTDGASVYVTGGYENQVDFDPTLVVEFYTSEGGVDCFLSRYSVGGNYQWSMAWGGIDDDDAGTAVAIDSMGNPRVTGHYAGTVDFSPHEWEVDNRTSNGGWDCFLSLISMGGVFDTAYTWGGIDDDQGVGITIDNSGNVIVCGAALGTVDFDPAGGGTLDAAGAFLSKFDSMFTWQWSRTWGAGNTTYAYDTDTDMSGNIYTGGSFTGNVEFANTGAPCGDTSVLIDSGSNSDAYLMKQLSDGCM